jgi:hypothetical protein
VWVSRERSRADRLPGASSCRHLAAAVGPSLGAYVVHTLGWPWAFFINVPVELGALWDIPGILMLICGMGAIALGVVKSSDWGWATTPTEDAIIAGLGALTGFVLWAARVKAPALDRSAPTRAGRSVGGGPEMTQNP